MWAVLGLYFSAKHNWNIDLETQKFFQKLSNILIQTNSNYDLSKLCSILFTVCQYSIRLQSLCKVKNLLGIIKVVETPGIVLVVGTLLL